MSVRRQIKEWARLVESRLEFDCGKQIDFPENEVRKLRGKRHIVTHRVLDDFHEFKEGDVVVAPWGTEYVVSSKDVVHDVGDSPYFDELTPDQRRFLEKFDDIAVLELDVVGSFRRIPGNEVVGILDEIPSYLDNERYQRSQFEKYLKSEKTIDDESRSDFFGIFDDSGKCLSMCYVNYGVPEGFVLIAEVQAVVHGYGKPLLERILDLFDNVWLAADPNGGESLLDYYRQFDMDETRLDFSKWVDGPETFFYATDDPSAEERLLGYLDSQASKG